MNDLFPAKTKSRPRIYAYSDSRYPGCLKVGYTTRDVRERVKEQYPTKSPDGTDPFDIVFNKSALRADGSSFRDGDVHKALERHKVERCEGEWFCCDVDAALAAYIAVLDRKENVERRCANFDLRPEQREAIERAAEYFQAVEREGRVPKFLWNAKMRFGKTFATYRLAKKLGFKRVLI